MAAPTFDLLLFGRRRVAAAAGSLPTHQSLTKARLRIVHQVFNDRRLVYRNRSAANRGNLVLSAINKAHNREEASQRMQRGNLLDEIRRADFVVDSRFTLLPSYNPIDLTEPKDFYRFGVKAHSAGTRIRSKSATLISRPYTAPLRVDHTDTDSDDEVIPVSTSRATSAKTRTERSISAVSNTIPFQLPLEPIIENIETKESNMLPIGNRITWPVKLRVFSLQDEDESRQQLLAWRAEQRKTKATTPVSKQFFDVKLERQYQSALRRRQEIEAFVTPQLIEEHRLNDPVFAKRHRQLRLAVRAGKVPIYDPNDREINIAISKSKIERVRTALITAKQSRIKNFYKDQQILNDMRLCQRIDAFLRHLSEFKEELNQEHSI